MISFKQHGVESKYVVLIVRYESNFGYVTVPYKLKNGEGIAAV
jgi:hypothetical protein